MATRKQDKAPEVQAVESEVTANAEDIFLFAVGTPQGELMLKIGADGNIMYLKDGATLDEAAKTFWNTFEGLLPVTIDEVTEYSDDTKLGSYIRARMEAKLKNKK